HGLDVERSLFEEGPEALLEPRRLPVGHVFDRPRELAKMRRAGCGEQLLACLLVEHRWIAEEIVERIRRLHERAGPGPDVRERRTQDGLRRRLEPAIH